MKKLAVIAAAAVLALALSACVSGTLTVNADDEGVHAVAKNGASGLSTAEISVKDGYGLCINRAVQKGSFHVKATDAQGKVVFDSDVNGGVSDLVPESGDFNLEISVKDATGTVDVIAYDIAAQAESEAKLPDELKQPVAETGSASASSSAA